MLQYVDFEIWANGPYFSNMNNNHKNVNTVFGYLSMSLVPY